MRLERRLPQYAAGLVIMAMGIVFIKRAGVGNSPLSAIPAAVASLTPLTLGNTTIAFHAFCVLLQILVRRRVTVKTLLTLPLAVAFGYLIDLLMLLFKINGLTLPMQLALCLAGIILTALGIVIIVGADLMLPAPDALLRAASVQWGRPLAVIKTAGDILWVAAAAAIDLVFAGKVTSIGIGTLASMLLTGKFVGIFKKHLAFLEMEPTDARKIRKSDS